MALFSRAEQPSEDINSRLFLMNKNGLIFNIKMKFQGNCRQVKCKKMQIYVMSQRILQYLYTKHWFSYCVKVAQQNPFTQPRINVHVFTLSHFRRHSISFYLSHYSTPTSLSPSHGPNIYKDTKA
jgi:hypothetical protein